MAKSFTEVLESLPAERREKIESRMREIRELEGWYSPTEAETTYYEEVTLP
jgi:hypothetical protein